MTRGKALSHLGAYPRPGRSLILSPARIELSGDQPRSVEYGDIYFARDGQNETRRVLIGPMQLEAMFRESPEPCVRIGELGFGTGLNFLTLCEAFLKNAPETTRLDYISFEKHPLSRTDLERVARSHSPPLAQIDELIDCWPHLLEGWHSRYMANGRIRLLLYFGDAYEGLLDFTSRCHAWLLDGFDPECNPEMWHQALLEQLALRSENHARVATYTARGEVRRLLESAGFEMRRIDQRPHKRHSLAGVLRKEDVGVARKVSEVGVVGAGFAGAFTAHLLALRGISVHLFDLRSASIPVALAHARLGEPTDPITQLRALAKGHSNDWYRRLGAGSGVLEAPVEARALRRMERSASTWGQADDSIRLLGPAESTDLTDFPAIAKSLWHSQCHVVGQEILDKLLNHPRIALHREEVLSCHATSNRWRLALRQGASQSFEQLVICAGAGSLRLLPHLHASCIPGQMDIARTNHALPIALVGKGFAVPLNGNQIALGATYERRALTELEARQENFERTNEWFRALGVEFKPVHQSCWRGQRVYHQDRLPMAGEVAAGLFVITAQGSAGSVLAPLCADLVVSQILRAPLPLTQALAKQVRANRSRAS